MGALKRFFFTLLTLGIVLTLAVIGTVWALNNFTGTGPVTARCTATAGELGSHTLAPAQADSAALITAISQQRELPARAATIGIATAMQESKLRNIDYGDRDSLGLFQQRPSQGWGSAAQVQDPRYATEAFYDVLARIKGYDDMPVTDAAQAVQRSAFPEAYAQHEDMARTFASALTGHSPAALNCRLHATTASDMSGLSQRLGADFPHVTARSDETAVTVEVPTATEADNTERALWSIGNWAVAVAETYGVQAVEVAGQKWTRAEPWTPTKDAKPTEGTTENRVVISFSAPE